MSLQEHGSEALQAAFLPRLLHTEENVSRDATWMTGPKGGSELGANVETIARNAGDGWRPSGDKYFASNLGA